MLHLKRNLIWSIWIWCLLVKECLQSQPPLFAMSDVTNDLGICALQILVNRNPGKNIAFSPYGLSSVSMLLYEGSDRNSALQLKNALQLPEDIVFARVGFRDLYRHLKTYFMSDGFLKGLILSRENICIRSDYKRILTFYGFDLPEHTKSEPCYTITTTSVNGGVATTQRPTTLSMNGFSSNLTQNTISSVTISIPMTVTTSSLMENKETHIPITDTITEITSLKPNDIDTTLSVNQQTEYQTLQQFTSKVTNPTTSVESFDVTTSEKITTLQMSTFENFPTTQNQMEFTTPQINEKLTSLDTTTTPKDQITTVNIETNPSTFGTTNTEINNTPIISNNENDLNNNININSISTKMPNDLETTISTNQINTQTEINMNDQTTTQNIPTMDDNQSIQNNVSSTENSITTLTDRFGTNLTTQTVTNNIIETTTIINNLQTIENTNDNSQTITENPNIVTQNIQTMNSITENQNISEQSEGITGVTTEVMPTTIKKNDKLSTIVEVTVLPPLTFSTEIINQSEGITEENVMLVTTESMSTTINKNEKLSTIVEVTVLPPLTFTTEMTIPETNLSDISTVIPITLNMETNNIPSDDNGMVSTNPTIIENNIETTTAIINKDNNEITTMNTIVTNPMTTNIDNDNTENIATTISNKQNDKLSTIIEVTNTPLSTINIETTEQSVITTIDSNNQNDQNLITNTDSSIVSNDQTTLVINEMDNNEIGITTVIPNIINETVKETLIPAASMNSFVQINGNFLDRNDVILDEDIVNKSTNANFNMNLELNKNSSHKSTIPSLILNYDYLNPENFQDYVNVVEQKINNDTDDFTEALIQDESKNQSNLARHSQSNNIKYTYRYYNPNHEIIRRSTKAFTINTDKDMQNVKTFITNNDKSQRNSKTFSLKYKRDVLYEENSNRKSRAISNNPELDFRNDRTLIHDSPLLYKIKSWIKYKSGFSHLTPYSYQSTYDTPYDYSNTRLPQSNFDWFLVNGVPKVVPMMRYSAVLPYAFIAPLDSFALEIPLDDEKYKLLILLPNQKYGLENLLRALPYCSIRAIYNQMRYVPVYATLPEFDIVEQISLIPTLEQLGVIDIFYLSKADLSTMSPDNNLFIRDIMQVVAIYAKKYNSGYVHEVPPRSTETSFTASHPFVYFVIDTYTKVSLLAGAVENPTIKHN